jgi:hypothetical protein
VIASDDDFGINSDGLMVTETTITQFEGWDPNGKAEFVRARKALQYAGSIDAYTKIMLDGNNGGYANDWLLGDRKTGEIAQLELGLKAHKLWRMKDGVLSGSNWARDPKVLKEDTPEFDSNNKESSPNARRARWDELLHENKGKIDVALAEKMLGDHADSSEKGRCQRAHALRARGWLAAGRERVGVAALLSRRSGTRKGHGCNDGKRHAHDGAHGSSVRRGFLGQAVSHGSSGVCLARALFAGYEGRSMDGVPCGPDHNSADWLLTDGKREVFATCP